MGEERDGEQIVSSSPGPRMVDPHWLQAPKQIKQLKPMYV